LINLSSVQILKKVQHLLQLGENFSLSFINKKDTIFEFIKNIEHNIKRFPKNTQTNIRNFSISIINNTGPQRKVPCAEVETQLNVF